MEVNRLLGDELTYELAIRGASVDGTVVDKRQRLRELLSARALDASSELHICRTKMEELGADLLKFDMNNKHNEYLRIYSRLLHIIGRLNNLYDKTQSVLRDQLQDKCMQLRQRLGQMVSATVSTEDGGVADHAGDEHFSQRNQQSIMDAPNELLPNVMHSSTVRPSVKVPVDSLVDVEPIQRQEDRASERAQRSPLRDCGEFRQTSPVPLDTRSQRRLVLQEPLARSTREEEFSAPNHLVENRREIGQGRSQDPEAHGSYSGKVDPSRSFTVVSKWNLYFDGTSSVLSFLERIEELRSACGISKHDLFTSAVVLFRGTALTWFRSNKHSIWSWDLLSYELKKTYLPSEFEEDIWNDIKGRTQGRDERVAIFVAIMESYFSKLPNPPKEEKRVTIMRRNLLPYLQNHLASHGVTSIAELVTICQGIEEVYTRTEKFRPPPANPKAVIEPSLMYRPRPSKTYGIHGLTEEENWLSTGSEEVYPSFATGVREATSMAGLGPRQVICFNCRKAGHMLKDCTLPLTKRCYRCGEPNFTVNSCPKCRAGNCRESRVLSEPRTLRN